MTPEKLIRLTTTITLCAAFVLFASKIGVWSFTDSASLLAAAVDNIGDFLAGLVAFVAVRYALRPADDKFKWGYSKAEPLASLTLGTLVCGSALFLIFESFSKIQAPTEVHMPWAVIAVMVFSIIITGTLFAYQRWVARTTQSTIIHTDSVHYQMDFLLNITVIATMYLQQFWIGFDSLFGLLIAVYILWNTFSHIIKHSFDQLMDKELSQKQQDEIISIIMNHSEVINYHELRTRRSGRYRFIQVHIDLDKKLTLEDAHTIADELMVEIEKKFEPAEVIIHQDPVESTKTTTSWIKV